MTIGPRRVKYQANLVWNGRSGGEIQFGNHSPIKLDMPVEFGGEGKYPCPDELFLSSISGCLLTTLLHFKQRFKMHIDDLQISVKGNVDLIGPEGYRITDLQAKIFIKTLKEEEEKIKRFIGWMEEYCHLTRSMMKGLHVNISSEVKYA